MKKKFNKPAVELVEEGLRIEFVGVEDESGDAAGRSERIEALITKIILLGLARGRPRKDEIDKDENETAA